jgi:hypothetical protein
MAVSFSLLQRGKPYHVGAQDTKSGAGMRRVLGEVWQQSRRRCPPGFAGNAPHGVRNGAMQGNYKI